MTLHRQSLRKPSLPLHSFPLKELLRSMQIKHSIVHVPHVHQPIPTSPESLFTKLTLVLTELEVDRLHVYLELLEVAPTVGTFPVVRLNLVLVQLLY